MYTRTSASAFVPLALIEFIETPIERDIIHIPVAQIFRLRCCRSQIDLKTSYAFICMFQVLIFECQLLFRRLQLFVSSRQRTLHRVNDFFVEDIALCDIYPPPKKNRNYGWFLRSENQRIQIFVSSSDLLSCLAHLGSASVNATSPPLPGGLHGLSQMLRALWSFSLQNPVHLHPEKGNIKLYPRSPVILFCRTLQVIMLPHLHCFHKGSPFRWKAPRQEKQSPARQTIRV